MTGDRPFRMLISYHYWKENVAEGLTEFEQPPEVFADSGAFSALSKGAPIDVHDFGAWAKTNAASFQLIANLDVIGDTAASAEGTWQNQRTLEEEYGLAVLPVFHAGEPWAALDRLLEHGYRYIGLGGLVGRRAKAIMPWLVACFQRVDGIAALHGFGLTAWEPLAELPWFSVDSTTWCNGFRFGKVKLYDDHRRRLTEFEVGHGRSSVHRYGRLLRPLGFDPADLAGEDVDRALLCRLAGVTWARIEEAHRERHGLSEVPGEPERGSGLRLYLASSNRTDLRCAAAKERIHQ